jgi:hypothetical protein
VRRHEQRLVGVLLLREPRREHVGAVRERLDPVEQAHGGVRDGREPHSGRVRGQRLRQQQAVPAACEDDPQAAGVGLARRRVEQPLHVRADRVERDRQAQLLGRAPQPLQVRAERIGTPAVQPHDLEDAVATQQALVGGGDARLGGGKHDAVEAGEMGGRHWAQC